MGAGVLYFGTFADYNCPDGKLKVMQYILELIGEDNADVVCTNKNISFVQRVKSDGNVVINTLNMCSNGKESEKYELRLRNGKTISSQLMPCRINEHIFRI